MRNTMIAATLFIFIPFSYLFTAAWDNHGLWLAMILFLLARSAFMSLYAPRAIFAGMNN
jgi:multidrug resistance protein, MATE family